MLYLIYNYQLGCHFFCLFFMNYKMSILSWTILQISTHNIFCQGKKNISFWKRSCPNYPQRNTKRIITQLSYTTNVNRNVSYSNGIIRTRTFGNSGPPRLPVKLLSHCERCAKQVTVLKRMKNTALPEQKRSTVIVLLFFLYSTTAKRHGTGELSVFPLSYRNT